MADNTAVAEQVYPYLQLAIDKGASDVYFTTHAPVMLRVEGEIYPVKSKTIEPLTPEAIEALVTSIMSDDQRAEFEREQEVDFAFRLGNHGRFRVNAFRQRGSAAMVLRNIGNVPTFDDFDLPPVLKRLAMQKRGLVIVVGATGSGKSTTLAAMISHRSENANGHILTIEDPIEFMYRHKRSIVNQRELGADTLDFARAVRSAMREAPDVVQIGETRDLATAEAALQLAGTGHLALTTLHGNNAYQALQRLIALFPESAREALFMDMSLNLRAIISQRLVAGIGGKRVAAFEILLNTPYIADLIRQGRIDSVREAMSEGDGGDGMATFDDSLLTLVRNRQITPEQALAYADSRENLQSKLAFAQV
ncbi:PilT/PilU family type 4a pilus ATPase [Endozoicomonas sp. G2_2]|uniref:PilT/PilU family type 4a pilus ATPase n=1 Tax=Gammaproteobacteria TaxID=1236 RepID=UPI000C5D7324|nr:MULTISPECIES: PilT/PilU family type 4a pilus ATPase [Gammaproteobacteria]MAS09068.1 type IV pili twitching motility protein PilT [Salinisphaera sp.]MAS11627.1 type IV pili twitching motility protein PilT [Salinisphaera sp.]MBO9471447.1 PilT/PilU family type 4a pilus ATPase [Endozoicomonas sp. G2_2]